MAAYRAEKEETAKKIAEATTAIVELLKTKSFTFNETEDVLRKVEETILDTIIVD